jgi:hypothetical protein
MAFFNLGLALLVTGDAEAASKEYGSGLNACAQLSPEDGCANLGGALGDLEKLSRTRPELIASAAKIRQKLENAQSALTPAGGSDAPTGQNVEWST